LKKYAKAGIIFLFAFAEFRIDLFDKSAIEQIPLTGGVTLNMNKFLAGEFKPKGAENLH
jgi:hypothetical protein